MISEGSSLPVGMRTLCEEDKTETTWRSARSYIADMNGISTHFCFPFTNAPLFSMWKNLLSKWRSNFWSNPDGRVGLGKCTPVSVIVRQAGGVPERFFSVASRSLPFVISDAVRFSTFLRAASSLLGANIECHVLLFLSGRT